MALSEESNLGKRLWRRRATDYLFWLYGTLKTKWLRAFSENGLWFCVSREGLKHYWWYWFSSMLWFFLNSKTTSKTAVTPLFAILENVVQILHLIIADSSINADASRHNHYWWLYILFFSWTVYLYWIFVEKHSMFSASPTSSGVIFKGNSITPTSLERNI